MRETWSRRRAIADRLGDFWQKYVGSVAFFAVIVVLILTSWTQERNDMRQARTERALDVERSQRDSAIAKEREARITSLVTHELAIARLDVESAKRLADAQLRTIRQANFEACERENQLRRRLRASVDAQIEISRAMGISALSRLSTVREYVEVMNRQENALVRLYDELVQVDCSESYPPVVVQ